MPPFPFLVANEHFEDGLWNPRDSEQPPNALQINLIGDRELYLKLAAFIREFAERDTSIDSDYHEHFEGIMSADGKTRLHLILRKDDNGDGCYSTFLPKET